MKNGFLLACLLFSSLSYASEDKIQFQCKNSFQETLDQTVAFSMIKLNGLESAKGSFYEAMMGKEKYLEEMEKTYEAIREENKNDSTFQNVFNFEKFESPISEIVRKVNRSKRTNAVSYEQVAQYILESSNSEIFCPEGKPMSLNQMVKIIKKEI